ncbi:MAG: MMPL family transporter [Pseudomonadota bacterium]
MIEQIVRRYRHLLGQWVGLVHHRAKAVLWTAFAVTLGLLYYTVGTLGLNTKTTDMLSRELPFRQNAEALKAAFPQYSDVILVVLEGENPDRVDAAAEELVAHLRARPESFGDVFYPAADPFFKKNGLLYLDRQDLDDLGLRLSDGQPFLGTLAGNPRLDGLLEMLGLATDHVLDTAEAEKKKAEGLTRILNGAVDVVEAMSAGRPRDLSWKTLMEGEPKAGLARQLIAVQPVLDFGSLAPAKKTISLIRALAQTNGLPEDVRLRLTGDAALDETEIQSIQEGMGLVGGVSVALVLGLLLIGMRSVRLVLAILLTLVMGLIWSFAFAAFAVGHLNLISVAFAVLFVGLSVDFGIHFALRFREGIERGTEPAAALQQTAEGVGGALTFCAISAAIGFYAFLPTAYRGVAELGLIAGTSMFVSLFTNLTILPALLVLLRFRKAPPTPRLRFDFSAVIRRRARFIVAASGGLALAGLVALPFARFDFNPLHLKDPNSEAMRTFLDLMEAGDIDPYAIAILAHDLGTTTALKEKLSKLPEVKEVVIPQDLVPKDQGEKLATIEDLSVILLPVLMGKAEKQELTEAERKEALAVFRKKIETLADSGHPADYVRSAKRLAEALRKLDATPLSYKALEERLLGTLPMQLERLRAALGAQAVTFETLPVSLKTRFLSKDGQARVEVLPAGDPKDPATLRRFIATVEAVAPNAAGDPITMLGAAAAVIEAFWQASALALVLITGLLALILRRTSDVLLVLAPLGLAALLTNLLAVLFVVPLNFANVIVLPLLLGIGVANGIHFVLRERNGIDVDVLHTSTPRAVLFSTLTTIGSFGSLMLSTHLGTASMGTLLTIALLLMMVCTLTLVPAFMAIRRKTV